MSDGRSTVDCDSQPSALLASLAAHARAGKAVPVRGDLACRVVTARFSFPPSLIFRMVRLLLALALVVSTAPTISAQRPRFAEPLRPQYHFTSARGWINDPNGMVWYKGEWHLFYQHNPFGDTWGHMSWGHAVSRDLVHWEHLPVALAEEGGIMIFSGSAVVDRDNTSGLCTSGAPGDSSCLVALYTGHTATNQSQHLAFSNDRGRHWTKYASNPVLDIGAKDFRDPKVFWYAPTRRWVMVVSLATQQQVRFYSSPNLREWTRLGEFGAAGATSGIWECPDLFELPVEGRPGETRWVLIVNINPGAPAGGSGAQYFVGRFNGETFVSDDAPAKVRWADYGKDFYAAVSWNGVPASDGRRVWLGWMSNWEYAAQEPTTPFRGAMTIPRVLSLRRVGGDVVLAQRPVRELRVLRGTRRHVAQAAMPAGVDVLAGRHIAGDALELDLELVVGDAREITLAVRRGGKELTVIGYDVVRGVLYVDRTRSGEVAISPTFSGRHEAPMATTDGRLRLTVFVDRSSLEVFGSDGMVAITDRIFPSPGSTAVELRAHGGTARIVRLDAWPLRSAW